MASDQRTLLRWAPRPLVPFGLPHGGGEGQRQQETGEVRLQSRTMAGLFVGYLLFGAVLTYERGGAFLTPDRIAVLLLAGAAFLGRGRAFVRDWLPFLLLLFGYELMRGVADNVANVGTMTRADHGRVQIGWLIALDKRLFFGRVPALWLQDRLYRPGVVHWYDALAAVIYLMHFVLPLVFGFVLWLRSRDAFRRFTFTLLAMSYGAFVFFLLLPTAPPWLAEQWGELDGLQRPSYQAYKLFLPKGMEGFDTFRLWTQASPNPVAALPSLHAAFPWLVMLFAVRVFGRAGWLLLPYNAAVWFSVLYLSQHWAVDVIAGVLWASAVYLAIERGWLRWAARAGQARSAHAAVRLRGVWSGHHARGGNAPSPYGCERAAEAVGDGT